MTTVVVDRVQKLITFTFEVENWHFQLIIENNDGRRKYLPIFLITYMHDLCFVKTVGTYLN